MQILLNDYERAEIEGLRQALKDHIKNYGCFNSFKKTAHDGLLIAASLLNNDYKTFKKYKLKYTHHTADKMRGIDSLSTYKKTSDVCKTMQYNANKNCICRYCYADKSINLYKASLQPSLIYNTLLLKYIDICADQIPFINDRFFRFESFSDLQSAKHFKNLLQICKKNKNTVFTLWTKAAPVLDKYMQQEKINKLPNNLNIIYSEPQINKIIDASDDYINSKQARLNQKNKIKVFSVFNDEKKRQESKMYLCKNKCIDCLKCYKKSKNIIYIAEKLH